MSDLRTVAESILHYVADGLNEGLTDQQEANLSDGVMQLLIDAGFAIPPKPLATKPRSPHWGAVRRAFLADHPTCAACGGKTDLEAHHRRPFAAHPELELEASNLVALCEAPNRGCHFRVGHSYNWQSINIHSVEDARRQLRRIADRLAITGGDV